MPTLTEQVDEIAKNKGKKASEVIEEALEQGVKDLWHDHILGKYLREEIDREEAIELVGLDKVKRAEKESEFIEDDIKWGLAAGTN